MGDCGIDLLALILSPSYLAHEQVDVGIHIQLLQLLEVACQLQEKAAKGDEYLDPHLHRMVQGQHYQGP